MRLVIALFLWACGSSQPAPAPPAPPDARVAPAAESPSSCAAPGEGHGVLKGIVVDAESAAQGGIVVRLATTRVRTTAQGTFFFCDVPAGQHTIGFTHGGVEVERPVQVTAGQETDVKLTIEAVGPAPVKLR